MDPIKVLIDLSHNESITSIPEDCFPDLDVLFEFVNPNDDISDATYLKRFNLLFLGNPQPRDSVTDRLFTPLEVKGLKSYVRSGGSIFLTTSSKGDFDLPRTSGSLRVLHELTGIRLFPKGILYMAKGRKFFQKNTNLLIDLFPKHQIFQEFDASDQVILGKCTYFILDDYILCYREKIYGLCRDTPHLHSQSFWERNGYYSRMFRDSNRGSGARNQSRIQSEVDLESLEISNSEKKSGNLGP
jgi:hypothetical protein